MSLYGNESGRYYGVERTTEPVRYLIRELSAFEPPADISSDMKARIGDSGTYRRALMNYSQLTPTEDIERKRNEFETQYVNLQREVARDVERIDNWFRRNTFEQIDNEENDPLPGGRSLKVWQDRLQDSSAKLNRVYAEYLAANDILRRRTRIEDYVKEAPRASLMEYIPKDVARRVSSYLFPHTAADVTLPPGVRRKTPEIGRFRAMSYFEDPEEYKLAKEEYERGGGGNYRTGGMLMGSSSSSGSGSAGAAAAGR
jgi:hypothetical protein